MCLLLPSCQQLSVPNVFFNTSFVLPNLFIMQPVHPQLLCEGRCSAPGCMLCGCTPSRWFGEQTPAILFSISKMERTGRQAKLKVNLQKYMLEFLCKFVKRRVLCFQKVVVFHIVLYLYTVAVHFCFKWLHINIHKNETIWCGYYFQCQLLLDLNTHLLWT